MKLKGVVLGVLFTIVIVLTGRYTYRLIWAANLSLNEAKVDGLLVRIPILMPF